MSNIAELKRQAVIAQNAWEQAIKKEQARCVHPYKDLEFSEGAVCSHLSGSKEQGMTVLCKACDKSFGTKLVINDY